VSNTTLPAVFIDSFATFLDGFLHRLGVFRRQTSEGLGEDGLPLFLADPLKPLDEVGGRLQLAGGQRLIEPRKIR